MFLMPYVLGFYFNRKFGTSWNILVLGSITLLASVPVSMLVTLLTDLIPYSPSYSWVVFLFESLVLGLLAELTRFLIYKLIFQNPSLDQAYMGGIGAIIPHSFMWAISIRSVLNHLAYGIPPSNPYRLLIQPALFLYTLLKQLPLQIYLTTLSVKTIQTKNYRHLLKAIGFHTTMDILTRFGYGMSLYDILPIRYADYREPFFIPGTQEYIIELILSTITILIIIYLVKQFNNIQKNLIDILYNYVI